MQTNTCSKTCATPAPWFSRSGALSVALAMLCLMGCGGEGGEPRDGSVPYAPQTQHAGLAGFTATGTNDSPGLQAQGGPQNGHGVLAFGSGDGVGVYGIGGGNGNWFGVYGVGGGATGNGTGGQGAGPGAGGMFAGGASGPGVIAWPGTAATATTRREAMVVQNGDIAFSGVNPAPTTPISNRITAASAPKAWAVLETFYGGAGVGIVEGMNVASANAVYYRTMTVNLAAPMIGACAATVTSQRAPMACSAECNNALIQIKCVAFDGGLPREVNFADEPYVRLSVAVQGKQ